MKMPNLRRQPRLVPELKSLNKIQEFLKTIRISLVVLANLDQPIKALMVSALVPFSRRLANQSSQLLTHVFVVAQIRG